MKISRTGLALLLSAAFAGGLGARHLAAQADDTQDTHQLLALFTRVFDIVHADYVDPVTDRTLIDNALDGMLTGLDPHSSYLTEREWNDMQTETTGAFGGIGLEVTDKGGLLEVVSPIDGTPAAAAGLKPGDLITAVDGKSVDGLSLDAAVASMRGPPGTTLHLTVKRPDLAAPMLFALTRQIIHVASVQSRLLGDIGVIRISEFTEQTNPGVREALRTLRAEAHGKLRGLVIDLRNDPGGLLDQAVAVANDFLDHGGIVSTRGRHADDDQSWTARPGGDIAGTLPVVVVTNNGTASAAEIVAGALQDNRRALVLGTQSFGKGSVQTLIPMAGQGAVRLTTARYYTPSGRSIQDIGITPDVVVEESRTPAPHFGPEHEADLLHSLANPDGTAAPPPPPAADEPAVAHQIPARPPEDWPALDPAKPATDFQLQQALVLVRAMAADQQAAR
jgi:carboxyl-terminal processing protease